MKAKEIKGDLFTADDKYVFAHCISYDLKMGLGIAKQFRDRFPRMEYSLLQTRKQNSACIYTDKSGRSIYNLITKEKYFGKPTRKSLNESLISLKKEMIINNHKYLAIPRIASDLDKLNWGKTLEFINNLFDDTDIEIVVYYIK